MRVLTFLKSRFGITRIHIYFLIDEQGIFLALELKIQLCIVEWWASSSISSCGAKSCCWISLIHKNLTLAISYGTQEFVSEDGALSL